MKLFLLFLLSTYSSLAVAGIFFDTNGLYSPKSLAKDVKFWEDIFSKYEANHCVYHDSKHLDVIYWVTELPQSRRAARSQIRAQKRQIKIALSRLRKGSKPKTWLEKKIKGVLQDKGHRGRFYRHAAQRIRCQRGVATDFRKSLKRSVKYLGMIRKSLKDAGLPLDIAYLPHLESGFNNRARSKAGARGLWQLMPATARPFMKVTRRRDDRVDPLKATRVAARILKENYRRTKSWPLAITAYNYGINGIVRAMKRYNTNSYIKIRKRHRTRIFGFAAKNFYPSFLAVRNLGKASELDLEKSRQETIATSRN